MVFGMSNVGMCATEVGVFNLFCCGHFLSDSENSYYTGRRAEPCVKNLHRGWPRQKKRAGRVTSIACDVIMYQIRAMATPTMINNTLF